MKLKLLDLFSGIGGFSLGLESTGYFKTIAFVEKDKFCQQVLQKNFKDTPIESEVRNVKGDRYAADIVTGGFPCQPFSVAGKRRGTDDDRYLWDETIRIIRECKPRWFIGENVEGIINIQEGVVLRQVQDDLEKEGFQVQCLVIPASGIGAWHQRKRVWILAYSEHNGSYRSKGNETIESSNEQEKRLSIRDDQDVPNSDSRMRGGRGTEQSSGANEVWRFCAEKEEQARNDIRSKTIGCDALLGEEDDANTNSIGLQRRSIQSNNLQETSNSTETTNTSSKEQYTWWQAQSKLCGVPNGISYELDKGRSNRIKSLGNSIVPLIARELGIAIMKAEQDG
nr:DNA (cytosine-5-)-methyltransferase (TIGR00675) [uncultured Mediterranean phage uvMED]